MRQFREGMLSLLNHIQMWKTASLSLRVLQTAVVSRAQCTLHVTKYTARYYCIGQMDCHQWRNTVKTKLVVIPIVPSVEEGTGEDT